MEASVEIVKSSGKRVHFSIEKLRNSLKRSGADSETIQQIVDTVRDELYQGISTKEIYHRAFALLKKKKAVFASKYKLKNALYELGPTGFPFEKFIAALLQYSGYETVVGQVFRGKCVTHEVDVVAQKKEQYIVAECKFHRDPSRKCDVKVPLYIHSRYRDILAFERLQSPNEGWVVTNTQFTKDAMEYGKCSGLYLLSWDYPKNDALKDRIDRLALYPITVSTLLSKCEKQFLLSRNVVLCRQLIEDDFYLDHLGVSENRKARILEDINAICSS